MAILRVDGFRESQAGKHSSRDEHDEHVRLKGLKKEQSVSMS